MKGTPVLLKKSPDKFASLFLTGEDVFPFYLSFRHKANLKKLFVSGRRVTEIFHTQAAGTEFFKERQQFHDLALFVNMYVAQYSFLPNFSTLLNETTIKIGNYA